ncbi:hypothetical protein P3X46_018273 [Hevea brasiliensis]|uniref:Uncharacterized protein n=1 Tax=Hevea brasiliensis TaxID=3981 RepID=A0ABQ9LRI4_HEVBR|nr:uncharacterized protein LOC110655260 [Hevea brasiliensis]KAJ9170145.1 hypothetical protein P3X46_018273 [Hevea brasiliensis]
MKDVSRNKFLLCFRPVIDMDRFVLDSKAAVKRSNNQHLSYVGAEQNKNVKHLRSKSSLLDYKSSTNSENSLIIHSPRKTCLSRLIKAVSFQSILPKKVRDERGLSQDLYGSKHNSSSSNSTESLNTSDDDSVNNVEIKTSKVSSPSSSSSSSFSSCSSGSTSISQPNNISKSLSNTMDYSRTNQEQESNPKTMGNTGIYLLLFSLTVTAFLGKLFAIFFTSILLYFVSRKHVLYSISPAGYLTSLPQRKESKEYAIIMEGVLEKDQNQLQRSYKFLT